MSFSLPELLWLKHPGGKELRGCLELAGLGCWLGLQPGSWALCYQVVAPRRAALLLQSLTLVCLAFFLESSLLLASVESFGRNGSLQENRNHLNRWCELSQVNARVALSAGRPLAAELPD